MSEWWTYTLSDFLMFSPRTYYRLIELYNVAIWPAQLAGAALGLAIVALLFAKPGPRDRIIAALLAIVWVWTAWAFHHQRYAQINLAAPYYAAAFAIEAVLLFVVGVAAGRLRFGAESGGSLVPCLLAIVVLAYPLLAPLTGRSWTAAEVFGTAPDPTALGSVAALSSVQGRVRWLLLIVPLLWCAIAAATWWTMREVA